MVKVKELIWDEWNRDHIAKHDILSQEVEEVCHGKFEAVTSYRKRILVIGKTKKGRKLAIVLSPEDRDLKAYKQHIYYPITAFEEVKK